MPARIEAAPGADAMLRALGLDHPGGWESFAAGEEVNRTSRGFVRAFRWPARGGDVFYFKLYRFRRAWKKLLSAFRRDPARREYDNLKWLRARGFPAVEPVAWGSLRTARVVRSCFLVTRAERGAMPLTALVGAHLDRRLQPAPSGGHPCPGRLKPAVRDERSTALEPGAGRIEAVPSAAERRAGIASLARLVRRLHDAGFFAHDLHLRNVLVDHAAEPDAGPRFILLDFPNGRVLVPGDARRRPAAVHDLATLDRTSVHGLSRADRLRFLKSYLGDEPVDEELVRAIEDRRRRLLAKHERGRRRHAAE